MIPECGFFHRWGQITVQKYFNCFLHYNSAAPQNIQCNQCRPILARMTLKACSLHTKRIVQCDKHFHWSICSDQHKHSHAVNAMQSEWFKTCKYCLTDFLPFRIFTPNNMFWCEQESKTYIANIKVWFPNEVLFRILTFKCKPILQELY